MRDINSLKYFKSLFNMFLIYPSGSGSFNLVLISTSTKSPLIAPFKSFFGFPAFAAINLAALPVIFSIYSLSCYWSKSKSAIYLKIISIANLTYCLITVGLVIYYFTKITIFGIVYFLIEKMIVIPLAVWEWKMAYK